MDQGSTVYLPGSVMGPLEVSDHEFEVIPTTVGVNVFLTMCTCICAGMKKQGLCLNKIVLIYDNERVAKELRMYRMEELGQSTLQSHLSKEGRVDMRRQEGMGGLEDCKSSGME